IRAFHVTGVQTCALPIYSGPHRHRPGGPLQLSGRVKMSHPDRLVIATRASRLALWQAEHVKARLSDLYPDCEVTLLEMTTRGDQILDRTLSKGGGKGLFVKELETALLDGRAEP